MIFTEVKRDLLTYLLTSWSTVLLEKLTVSQLIKKFPAFYGTQMSISGSGSSVGIVTGYGLDGPGIESLSGRDFPHLSRTALGPTQPPIQ